MGGEWCGAVLWQKSKLFQKGVGTADQEPIESAPAPSSRALDRCTAQAVGSWLRFSLRWTTRTGAGGHDLSEGRRIAAYLEIAGQSSYALRAPATA